MSRFKPGTAIIRRAWDTLSPLPGGKRAFSRLIGRMAPYTGTIGATVVTLSDGYGEAVLEDRKCVRNHLDSVHAIALANFGEMVSGVTMLYSLDPSMRGILTGIDVDYLKKARGLLRATCTMEPIRDVGEIRTTLTVEIRDAADEVVCVVRPRWKLSPR